MIDALNDIQTPLLVLGVARSGKSQWAESFVKRLTPPYVYLATAEALDEEMKVRIQLHRERRKDLWETIESPTNLASALRDQIGMGLPVLVDCITLWLSNLLLSCPEAIEPAIDEACAAIENADFPLVIVSNEVGGGIVPENALAREFRDLCGVTNQRLASICRSVVLVTAGLPLRLK